MELTQKIECTQELYANTVEKEVPDQIGFLGICGVKYPLKKGPNKIGRDPNTCNIVLNLNSISRQHAVINILNNYDFMLMDLDSANKTKLADKTLQAYIPTPLRNGDMVQFGQVFGVFRLFEDENDLPMTQALDIPETPVRNRHVSKVNLITTIPESPDVSDKDDDSFIVPSQPKPKNVFKSPSTNFIKSSGKTITIKPVGSNKIDNVYWSSSKKSDSFNLESDTSMNTSLQTSKVKENIHEQDTQVHNNINNFIYEADTQVGDDVPPIHDINTQLPIGDNLPEVHKVHGQENVNIDLFTENKENHNNIHNSETQDVSLLKGTGEESKNIDKSSNENVVSDDIILFDEIHSPTVEEDFESQALLLPELEENDQIGPINEGNIEISDGEKLAQNLPISNRRDSGSSTDCEDIDFALTQNIQERRTNDDDSTDCEDAPELINEINQNQNGGNSNNDDNLTDCENEIEDDIKEQKDKLDNNNLEDLATQIIEASHYNVRPTTSKNEESIPCLEDLPTQIIDEDKNCRKENSSDQLDLEDLPTQKLHQEPQNIFSEKDPPLKVPVLTPFKVPVTSPLKRRRKDQTEPFPNKEITNITKDIDCEDEEKYYAATQELLDDLCTQRELSPEIVSIAVASKNVSKDASGNDQTTNNKSITNLDNITEDIDEKIDQFVMNLTNSVIKDVDIETEVAPLKKVSSDSSDFESTPKKLRPSSFLETKLPNTDEIKKYLRLSGYASTESSKGSDTDGSNHGKPHIHKRKSRKVSKRVDLTTKFEPEKLPERVITRVRKPTSKMLYTENDSQKGTNKKPQSRSRESDPSKEKETSASDTSTPNLQEKFKESKNLKQTNKKGIKKNDVHQETNKSKENNKTKEHVGSRKNNESKESVGFRENKSKERSKTQENDRSKESNETAENVKNKRNSKNSEKKQTQEKNKSNKAEKKYNETTNRSIEIEKQSEKKATRKSSRTKEKQYEVKKDDGQLKDVTDEVKKLKIETGKSITKMNESAHSKTGRKKSNTIDKYLLTTPAEYVQRDETKTTETRSRRSKNKETTNCEASIETEVRRSKRQRTAKRSFDTIKPKSNQIIPSNHEQSTVYNISSESGVDSPHKLKRQASDFSLPTAKKNKTTNSYNVVLRTTPARKIKTHVLFTAFPCEEVKVKLENLGAVIVTDIMECTVVLTLQIRRTFKLLCAVGLGKPIVGANWVQACVDTNTIVDPWKYLIKDEITEKRFQFNLERILLGNRQFLKGYNVSSTPNIMPTPPEMKLIVECSGGTWTNGGKNWICVSSKSDKSLWTSLKRKGATIVSTEFILGGVLRQTIDIQRNTLA